MVEGTIRNQKGKSKHSAVEIDNYLLALHVDKSIPLRRCFHSGNNLFDREV
jgi:hypothetical protein